MTKVTINKNEILSNVFNSQEEYEFRPMVEYHELVSANQHNTRKVLKKGEDIIIQEQLKGKTVSLKCENGIVRVFGFDREIDENDTELKSFYNWVQENIKPTDLIPMHIYFGMWIEEDNVYGSEYANKLYLFDLYSEIYKEYLDLEELELEANELNLNIVPTLYNGKSQGLVHAKSFLDKSILNNDIDMKGIVIKNVSHKNKQDKQVYLKVLHEGR